MIVNLLRADPHRYGPGKVHLLNPDDHNATLCGKKREACPGRIFAGPFEQIDCQLCRKALATQERRRHWEAEWRRREAALATIDVDDVLYQLAHISRRNLWAASSWAAWWQDAAIACQFYERVWREFYAEYLRSPGWRDHRSQALARDGHRCMRCGGPATQVHHLEYPRNVAPGSPDWVSAEHDLEILRSICRRCHKREHGELQ